MNNVTNKIFLFEMQYLQCFVDNPTTTFRWKKNNNNNNNNNNNFLVFPDDSDKQNIADNLF